MLDAAHGQLLAATRAAATTGAAAALSLARPDGGGGSGKQHGGAEERQRTDAMRELFLHPDRCASYVFHQLVKTFPFESSIRAIVVCLRLVRRLFGMAQGVGRQRQQRQQAVTRMSENSSHWDYYSSHWCCHFCCQSPADVLSASPQAVGAFSGRGRQPAAAAPLRPGRSDPCLLKTVYIRSLPAPYTRAAACAFR